MSDSMLEHITDRYYRREEPDLLNGDYEVRFKMMNRERFEAIINEIKKRQPKGMPHSSQRKPTACSSTKMVPDGSFQPQYSGETTNSDYGR